jgi:hypothetical protein
VSTISQCETGTKGPSEKFWRNFLHLENNPEAWQAPVPVVVPDNYRERIRTLRVRLGLSQKQPPCC